MRGPAIDQEFKPGTEPGTKIRRLTPALLTFQNKPDKSTGRVGQKLESQYEFSGLKSKSLKRRSDQRYANFSIIGM